ncbi:ligase-associated DNA damage response DEXH box helicase [Parvularcula sp. LCG005]|uniref:ligase-associated DNA damage response DEXH box helicase n=1 Tax=Parvularcula sp. LCG005 TaxID=3078805 RepID=UPI002943F4F3|nr:ligase-associated DNA damage response DEXH box helicase [Parvularcula sp. LCG005]WOI52851.1 ligase-associated DNA damage response DEXH box helicase [Parvularcula sp. LCG005]
MAGHPAPELNFPARFADWFAGRGWVLRAHQRDVLEAAQQDQSALLIAPTGGGKTLAGFLPSLIELSEAPKNRRTLHTLYISPLKALAVDIARNLDTPIREMDLPISVESRTGDTSSSKRQRQRDRPPDILLTTPEQLALLLAHPSAEDVFSGLRSVIVDELHALAGKKRGDLLSLDLARLWTLAPGMRTIGLSATVDDPEPLRHYLVPQHGEGERAALIRGTGGARPDVSVMTSAEHIPWSGHSGRHAFGQVYEAIRAATTTLVFTNTRSQAEVCFAELWRMNDDNLPIALHHGSLDREQRERVEAAMSAGDLRAIVCTATLDLGIDWGDVDLVICLGAPKGAARLVQRIGRANHRMDDPSKAYLVPGNRFEVLECVAAKEAVDLGLLDGDPARPGALDVLCQHIWGMACAEPFHPDHLYREIISAYAYRALSREQFDQAVDYVATGGYAMRAYDRYKRIVRQPDGRYRIRDQRIAQLYRMNAGTIVELPTFTVRLGRFRRSGAGKASQPIPGKKLGTVEEWFLNQITPGDTFLFAGQVLKLIGVHDTDVYVTPAPDDEPKIPTWQGAKFPISSFLAGRVREMVSDERQWTALPPQVREWLGWQKAKSTIPRADELLVECFARGGKYFLVCYPFDGRIAHQSLGTLLTRRLERAGVEPIGFCPTEYALSIWMRQDPSGLDMDALFHQDMLGDDLEAWLADAQVMKSTFRNCALIAGLIERNYPGADRKMGRQITFSTSLIYDVLRTHEPDHILLKAAWADAAAGFLDIARISALLERASGHIVFRALERVSPMAVPVLMEVGRETVPGGASDAMLRDLEADLISEMMASPINTTHP